MATVLPSLIMEELPTEQKPTPQYERIRKALEPFALDAATKDKVAQALERNNANWSLRDVTESAKYLDFETKVNNVVSRFSAEGLTVEKYLAAAMKQPSLFCQSPVTIEENIRNLVGCFSTEGLTVEKYLAAAVKQPSLFYQSPVTIEENIRNLVGRFSAEGLTVEKYLTAAVQQPPLFTQSPTTIEENIRNLVGCFSTEGLTVEKYLAAAVKQPSLFCQSPVTIEENIRNLVGRFSAEGLTVEKYLTAAVQQPSLFTQSPVTIEENIRNLVEPFSAEGLTVEKYLAAAMKQPTLFSRSPATIESHIRLFLQMGDEGVLNVNTAEQSMSKAVMGELLKAPVLLVLAEDNILQRQALARLKQKPLSLSSIPSINKAKITHQLAEYVAALDHPLHDWVRADELQAETPRTVIHTNSIEYGEMLLVSLAKRGALDPALCTQVINKIEKGRG